MNECTIFTSNIYIEIAFFFRNNIRGNFTLKNNFLKYIGCNTASEIYRGSEKF